MSSNLSAAESVIVERHLINGAGEPVISPVASLSQDFGGSRQACVSVDAVRDEAGAGHRGIGAARHTVHPQLNGLGVVGQHQVVPATRSERDVTEIAPKERRSSGSVE